MAQRIQIRRDTAAQWVANNPTLSDGEIGIETDTLKLKIGNGVAAWNDLSYGLYATVDDFTVFQDTITTLISSVTGDITTAQFTADTAQTSADAAQMTANNALSLATTAETDFSTLQDQVTFFGGDTEYLYGLALTYGDIVTHNASEFVLASSFGDIVTHNAAEFALESDFSTVTSNLANLTASLGEFAFLTAGLGEFAFLSLADVTDGTGALYAALSSWLDAVTDSYFPLSGFSGLPIWIDSEISDAINTAMGAYAGALNSMCAESIADYVAVVDFDTYLAASMEFQTMWDLAFSAATIGPIGGLPAWVDGEITNVIAANVPFMGFRYQQRSIAGAPGPGEIKWDGAILTINQFDCDGNDLLAFWGARATALGAAVLYIAVPQSVGAFIAFTVTAGTATGAVYTFGTPVLIAGIWAGGFNMSYILIA